MMLKTEKYILLDLVAAAERSKDIPNDKEATASLQKCIHISRQIINGKLDIGIFDKFFAIRFPENESNGHAAKLWLSRFVEGWEWHQGDYSTRRALQQAAPNVYPTDSNEYFNRLITPEVKK